MNPDLPTPTVGRTVLYVLPSDHPRAGEIRPATIVRVNPDTVNLSVHCDGPNDNMGDQRNIRWVGSASLDQESKNHGTWHWMDYQIENVTEDPQAEISETIGDIVDLKYDEVRGSNAGPTTTASGGTDVHGD